MPRKQQATATTLRADRIGCDLCRHFDRDATADGPGVSGWCRRNPPAAVIEGDSVTVIWPPVDNEDWCGEFVRMTH